MKKIFYTLLFVLIFVQIADAQNKTILITETDLPYYNENCFWSGSGKLQEALIKSNWDEGREITTAAYTNNGWFVSMAKGTEIKMQTYKISTTLPSEWIKNNWAEDYYITSISKSNSQWLVVMSKEEGYTNQTYNMTNWNSLSKWVKENWDAGYYITNSCYNGQNWAIVMSKHSKFVTQGYFWVYNYDELKAKIKTNVWDKGLNIQLIEYGDGEYFVVYCEYKDNNERGQYFIENPADINNYLNKCWSEKYRIAYIGGGYLIQSSQSTRQQTDSYEKIGNAISEIGNGLNQILGSGNTYGNNNYSSGSYNNNSSSSSGSGSHYSEQKCSFCMGSGKCQGTSNTVRGRNQSCHGSGKCYACHGTGLHSDYNGSTRCEVCGGSKKCPTCNGTGKCKKCNGTGKVVVRN